MYNGGFELETSTSAIFDRLAGNVSYPDNNSTEDDTAQDKGHVPQLARDFGRTLQLNLENKELIELADSTNTSNSIEFSSTCFSAADIATVSDGEDVESLKNTGTTKAITWDDGTKMKKTRLRNISGVPIGKAIRFVTNRRSHVCTIVRPEVDTQPDIIKKNKESICTNTTRLQAKQSHEEMSQASGLARSDGKFHVEEGTEQTQTTYADAATSVPNRESEEVRIRAVRQKRKGRGKQPSYFDITPELHYLR